MTNSPISDEEVVAAYQQHRSIWRAAEAVGLSGQTVSRRLKKLGVPTWASTWFTDEEKQRIRDYYENTPSAEFSLTRLAKNMGRKRHTVCKIAGEMGLTNPKRPHSEDSRKAQKAAAKGKWSNKPHPRGMLGKKHKKETLKRFSEASKRNWRTWETFGIGACSEEAIARREKNIKKMNEARARKPESVYSRCKSGRREDLGETFFRSSWEANYARYLNLLLRIGAIERWEYEPVTFWFEGIKRGVTSYKPDFRITHKGDPTPEYIEVKGWVTPKDRTKWKRMAKYHPDIKLTVVGEKEYRALQKKWASGIPGWESDKGGGRKLGPRKAKGISGARVSIERRKDA